MDGETDSTEGPSQSSDEFAQLKTVDDNSFNSKIKGASFLREIKFCNLHYINTAENIQ